MRTIKKKCFVCKGTGKYGRLYAMRLKPQPCWVCNGTSELVYRLV